MKNDILQKIYKGVTLGLPIFSYGLSYDKKQYSKNSVLGMEILN